MNLWIALAGTLALELYVLRRMRFDAFIRALVVASTLLGAHYLGYTSVEERNYDGQAQLEYIELIARHARIPGVDDCGPCGHPPLYYALGALWTKTVLSGAWLPLPLGLGWLSLLLSFGFALVALLTLRHSGLSPWTFRLAAALVLFWPSSIIHSVRVHNDTLASLLMLTAMYFIARWDSEGRAAHFYAALAASALALLTKATGYTVAASLLFFAVFHLRSAALRRGALQHCAVAVVVLATAATLATSFRQSGSSKTLCQQVLGHACDGRYVPVVVDRPSRFIYFDVGDFVRRLDTTPLDPEHDYFLNRLAKSSLFGVMPLGEDFQSKHHERLGSVMSVLLLVIVAACALGLPLTLRGARLRKHRAYLVTTAIMLAFLVAFRLRAPNEFHEDFRHIFAALVPLCLGYACVVERPASNACVVERPASNACVVERPARYACVVERPARYAKTLRVIGLVVGAAMVVASIAFFTFAPSR